MPSQLAHTVPNVFALGAGDNSGDGGSNDFLRKSFEPDEVEVIPCAGEKAERHVSAEDVSAGARLCLRHGTPPIVPYRAAVFNPGMADRGLPICAGRDRCCAQTADGAGLRQPYKINDESTTNQTTSKQQANNKPTIQIETNRRTKQRTNKPTNQHPISDLSHISYSLRLTFKGVSAHGSCALQQMAADAV